ncbi:histidine phosphatase family protein [Planctomycetes bacterium K23_9]|uniref:Phosphoserine phosphatase 2 n=1 Tax=Stieleria marina TaxID=1930275 RepID=A0A517NS75_9BACT|nr:Putative phosphoserine phosphatase 2 [Planctomycetes bacterium K23_9]
MHLYLIRHAESENNAKPAYQRVEDPGLTPVGHLQSQHLATWLETLKFDVLITSPFRRALQTIKHFIDASPRQIDVWHDVFERGGCFRGHGPQATQGGEGLGRNEIGSFLQCDPSLVTIDETISENGWWYRKARETDSEAKRRAKVVRQRVVDTFGQTQQSVVVVSHADFIELLLAEIFAGVLDTSSVGLLRNTGITRLNFSGDQWELDWLNSVSHLPAKLSVPRA